MRFADLSLWVICLFTSVRNAFGLELWGFGVYLHFRQFTKCINSKW